MLPLNIKVVLPRHLKWLIHAPRRGRCLGCKQPCISANLEDILHASTGAMALLNTTFLQEHTGISASVCDDYRHSKDLEDQPQDMRAESESSHVEKQKLESRDVSLCYCKAYKVKMQPPSTWSIWVSQAKGGMCGVPAWRRRRWWVDAFWTSGLSSAAGCSRPRTFPPAEHCRISATPAPREPPPPARSARTPPGAPPAGAPSPGWRAGAPPLPGGADEPPRTPCWSWEWRAWMRAPWRRRTRGRNGPAEPPTLGGSLPSKWSAWWPERPGRGGRWRTRTATWPTESEEGATVMEQVSQVGGGQDAGPCFRLPRLMPRRRLCPHRRCFSAAASWPSSCSRSSRLTVNVPLLLLLRQSGDVQRSGRKQLHSLIRDLSRESAWAMPGRGLHVRRGLGSSPRCCWWCCCCCCRLWFCCRHLHLRPKHARHSSAPLSLPLLAHFLPPLSFHQLLNFHLSTLLVCGCP